MATKPKRADLENALALLASVVRRAVDQCPVCKGEGLKNREEWYAGSSQTHCDYCWDLREALRRVEGVSR